MELFHILIELSINSLLIKQSEPFTWALVQSKAIDCLVPGIQWWRGKDCTHWALSSRIPSRTRLWRSMPAVCLSPGTTSRVPGRWPSRAGGGPSVSPLCSGGSTLLSMALGASPPSPSDTSMSRGSGKRDFYLFLCLFLSVLGSGTLRTVRGSLSEFFLIILTVILKISRLPCEIDFNFLL